MFKNSERSKTTPYIMMAILQGILQKWKQFNQNDYSNNAEIKK